MQTSKIEVWAYPVFKVAIPWLTIRLIPIRRPKTVELNLRKYEGVCTPIRTPDFDTFDLNGHVHACIHSVPALRNVPKRSPIFPLSVSMTIPSRPNDVPERALRNVCFSRPLPQPFLLYHHFSLVFHFLLFQRERPSVNRGKSDIILQRHGIIDPLPRHGLVTYLYVPFGAEDLESYNALYSFTSDPKEWSGSLRLPWEDISLYASITLRHCLRIYTPIL